MLSRILLTTAIITAPISMSAANDDDDMARRWAVIAGMNISCPTTQAMSSRNRLRRRQVPSNRQWAT